MSRSFVRFGFTATLGGAILLSGCASAGGGQVATGPAAAPAETGAAVQTAELQPSPEAMRVADSARLSGRELGTMWTFENPPLSYWDSAYGFRPDSAWLRHVRLSAVRYGQICSASFVSPDGLVMTNHHCGRECTSALSSSDSDYVTDGFYAKTRADERVCPGLHLDQLVKIRDVTARVRQAVPAGASATVADSARSAAQKQIEDGCTDASAQRYCQVVDLYHGGQYQLYEYHRYAPVKMVFAPELQAGYFGGDYDNFTYPRYALDVTFVRAYRPDSVTPASTPDYFEWNPDGAKEGDLLFIVGNPGSTQRLATVSQLEYEKEYRHPFIIQILEGRRDYLKQMAKEGGPKVEQRVRESLFGIENSLKAYRGELGGLQDSLLMGRKIRWEREFKSRVASVDSLQSRYADVWDKIARLQERKLYVNPRLNLSNFCFGGSPQMRLAGMLVTYLRSQSGVAGAPDEFCGESMQQVKQTLDSRGNASPRLGLELLSLRLSVAERWLPADDGFMKAAFQPGETASQAAGRLIQDTQVDKLSYREGLLSAGAAALDTVSDPLVRLAVFMADRYPEMSDRWQSIQAGENEQQERLADALFAVFGTHIPPDATFTLRISDGVVKRYPYNGTLAPAHTQIAGMYERSANFGGEKPFDLPKSFAKRRSEVKMFTPLDFVSTNDITGGNSGSPMVDRQGRVVGIAFDGNIEQLPNQFLFRTGSARMVAVDAAGILESLKDVYQANRIVKELQDGTAAAPSGDDGSTGR